MPTLTLPAIGPIIATEADATDIVGDISAYTAKSAPLCDFVSESNARGQTRFLLTSADL